MNKETGTADGRPWLLAETNWKAVQDTNYELAVLPWGATEAHNYHLPYATDNYQADHVAAEAGRLAWERGALPIVFPCLPFGVNTGQLDIDLCMNILPSTQLAILQDLADVVERAAISKLVILNGHGGNNFKAMIRELSFHFPDLYVCWINWYDFADWSTYFEDLGDHAGELETSCIQHIAPGLVRPLEEAGTGKVLKPVIKAMREGRVSSQRPWSLVTEDTGVGDPSRSTADKGKRYLEECVRNIADFFVELGKTPVEDFYRDEG